MKRFIIAIAAASAAFFSSAQPVVTPAVDLYGPAGRTSSHADTQACVDAAAKAGVGDYECRPLARVSVTVPPPKSITYISDCGPGAAENCVAGSNLNAGTDPTAPRQSMAGLNISKRGDGEHVVAFSRGGAVPFVGLLYPKNLGKQATQTLTFTDYQPAWDKTKALPILSFAPAATGGVTGISLIGGGNGYTFRNLDLVGPGGAGTAIFVYRTVSNVLIENVTLREFGIGINASHDGAQQINGLTVRNSRFLNNSTQGFLGSGHDTALINNLFDNNGFKDTIRYHNIYLSGKSNNVVVRGNTLTRNAIVDGKCTAVSLVGHGQFTGLVIEDNTVIEEAVGWGCYGIQMNGYNVARPDVYFGFDGAIIRRNTVVLKGETGALGIGVNACPNCLIEDNTIVGDTVGSFTGIAVPDGTFTTPGSKDNAVTIRGNRLYVDSGGANVTAIRANAAGATGDSLTGNTIVFGPRSGAGAECVVLRPDVASYAALDNTCHREAPPAFSVPSAENGWSFKPEK